MKRSLLNLLTALSLLLCLAVCALWVRSHFDAETVTRTLREIDMAGSWRNTTLSVGSGKGAVTLGRSVESANLGFGVSDRRQESVWWSTHTNTVWYDRRPRAGLAAVTGFDFIRRSVPHYHDESLEVCAVRIPYWAIALLAAVQPGWRFAQIAWRGRTRRRTTGLCPACGYDLTGNVSGACPECGQATRRRPA